MIYFDVYTTETHGSAKITQKSNAYPLPQERAEKWVRDISKMIAEGKGGRFLEVQAIPCEVVRPWTPELWGMFQRELRRYATESCATVRAIRTENERLRREARGRALAC